MEKKLDGNYTRMLRAILNKSWRKHPTKHQLYCHLRPITKTILVRRTRHGGHCWRSRDELISVDLQWTPPHMAEQKQDDQLEPTFSSSVRIWDVALRTCQKWWTVGKSGEGGAGISVLAARHDDDDDAYNQPISNIPLYSNQYRSMSLSFLLYLSVCLIYLSLPGLVKYMFSN